MNHKYSSDSNQHAEVRFFDKEGQKSLTCPTDKMCQICFQQITERCPFAVALGRGCCAKRRNRCSSR